MKKILVSSAVCLLIAWASMVSAHGPVRQKVVEKIDIDAPPAKVWAEIKDFGNLSWLPPVKSTVAENLPTVDGKCEENDANAFVWGGSDAPCASRVLTLKDGGTITEMVKKYNNKKMIYSYRITDMSTAKTIKHSGEDVPVKVVPVSNYSATIMVKDNKKGGSQVIWKSGFYRGYMNNNPPPELTEEVAIGVVSGIFKSGLENLKKSVEAN